MANSSSQDNQDPEEDEIELPEGLDLMEGGGWGEKISNWFQENFSSVVLPIIALLILGGGIYMYSQNQAQLETPAANPDSTSTEITLDEEGEDEEVAEEEETADEEQDQKQAEEENEQTKETEKQEEKEEVMGGPVEKEKSEYTVETKTGEGITHLARRTAKKHLENKEDPPELSAEHKIYIEDYLQNRKGTRELEPGEELSFSEDLVEEAIDASQNLTESQLDNLTQYANQVPSL